MSDLIVTLFLIFYIFVVIWFILRLQPKKKFYNNAVNLYFGPPGCGKTTFLAQDNEFINRKMKCTVFTNIDMPYSYKVQKEYFGKFRFPDNAVILFDEGSLNGYDNRDFKSNFSKAPEQLSYFKLIRHYRNRIVFTNQGYNELDAKIRTLTEYVWLVKPFLKHFSIATRIYKDSVVDKDTHQVVEGYFMPNLFKILFIPSWTRIVYRKKYYDSFDSFELPAELPPVPLDPWRPDSVGLCNEKLSSRESIKIVQDDADDLFVKF